MTRTISYAFGVLLAVLGIWGFVQNPVFGIFEVGKLHSLVYLVSGAALLASAAWSHSAAGALQVLGVLYALASIMGFITDGSSVLWLLHNSVANNIFHTLLAVICLWAGFFMAKEDAMPMHIPAESSQ